MRTALRACARAKSDTVRAMLFDFTLVPLDEIEPWGKPGQLSLHWFGLTDGYYWMDVGSSTLFEYSELPRRQVAERPAQCGERVRHAGADRAIAPMTPKRKAGAAQAEFEGKTT